MRVHSRHKVITYVSVTCLWGEKAMERVGCLQNSALWKGRWMLCLFTNTPLFFRIPSTSVYLFSLCYQTPSSLNSPQSIWALYSLVAYHFSRESFFNSYLSDHFYFFHTYYLVCFLSLLPCCCHRKQRSMKRQQNFPLQLLHDLLKVLLSCRQQTGAESQSRSNKILKARYRPASLQQVIL